MKYILVFLTLIWTLTKAEFDEICDHPTESLESKKAQCLGFEPSRKTKLLGSRQLISRRPPRPKLGHRSLNSEKPAVVHLVSLQRRFLISLSLHIFKIHNRDDGTWGAHPQILQCNEAK